MRFLEICPHLWHGDKAGHSALAAVGDRGHKVLRPGVASCRSELCLYGSECMLLFKYTFKATLKVDNKGKGTCVSCGS